MSQNQELKSIMDQAVERINQPSFIPEDPVQFPRRFSRQEDIEIAALLCAHIAWGNRKMICRDCNRLLELMDNQPYRFVMEEAEQPGIIAPDSNIHRTFFGRDLLYFIRGLKQVYAQYGTLENFAVKTGAVNDELPSWKMVESLNRLTADANVSYQKSVRCLPDNLKSTPLKRVNMALRWLVRNDGIVDMGVWKALKPSQLFIPLDVHVADTSRTLNLLSRKSNDRKAVLELTDALRKYDAEDPIKYDFALFGLGIEKIF
ncbi:MAG: TIGR02757 family protein [Muribaculaceae bacterium]|nr:TIGR02757 family protein [Muribaculaceae bacterium]MDE5857710.1 TIGR02757 family protein [Muribaculaceae bacterium]MDE7368265.1 TIGR02757 family protein [Muribaculaceae bacterium]